MNAQRESFLALTAADLMSPAVVTIPRDMPLPAAAERLAEADLKGAPVVDEEGRCVGVISTTDFLYLAMRKGVRVHATAESEFFTPWKIIDPCELPNTLVRHFMKVPPCSVAPETPIGELARIMVDSHFRRLVVVRDDKLVGLVSATDLMRALATYAESEVAHV